MVSGDFTDVSPGLRLLHLMPLDVDVRGLVRNSIAKAGAQVAFTVIKFILKKSFPSCCVGIA